MNICVSLDQTEYDMHGIAYLLLSTFWVPLWPGYNKGLRSKINLWASFFSVSHISEGNQIKDIS